jgi:hypothetical protein
MAHHSSAAGSGGHSDTRPSSSAGAPWLAFLLGALLVVVAGVVGYFYFSADVQPRTVKLDVQLPQPSAPLTPPKMPTPSTPTQ